MRQDKLFCSLFSQVKRVKKAKINFSSQNCCIERKLKKLRWNDMERQPKYDTYFSIECQITLILAFEQHKLSGAK